MNTMDAQMTNRDTCEKDYQFQRMRRYGIAIAGRKSGIFVSESTIINEVPKTIQRRNPQVKRLLDAYLESLNAWYSNQGVNPDVARQAKEQTHQRRRDLEYA